MVYPPEELIDDMQRIVTETSHMNQVLFNPSVEPVNRNYGGREYYYASVRMRKRDIR